MTRIVIMGGGPAGYEAALVAAQHGSDVTVVERDGMGGACVLDDCVPSKTFISSAGIRVDMHRAPDLGRHRRSAGDRRGPAHRERTRQGARARPVGGRPCPGRAGGRPDHPRHGRVHRRAVRPSPAPRRGPHSRRWPRGASGRRRAHRHRCHPAGACQTPRPDGERILTWRQLYDLQELPEHLIVVGSGVTGAEFVSAYVELGARVTLVSSRDRVLPGEDADAAAVLQDVFAERGVEILPQARADSVKRDGDGVVVTLADGRTVTGSHALMTVGSVPNTTDLGLEKIGVETGRGGFIPVDRVSRTSVPGVYAAGDCTGAADARLGRRHAGPDRDVARPRRGRGTDQAQDGGRRRVHAPRDRHRRHQPAGDRRRRGAGPHDHAAAVDESAREDAGSAAWVREAVLPAGHRRRRRRCGRGARWRAS